MPDVLGEEERVVIHLAEPHGEVEAILLHIDPGFFLRVID